MEMEMEKEVMMEIDSKAENPINTPPPHLGCESQNQSQTQEEEEEEEKEEKNKGIAMMIMLGKKRPFSSPSEADGGEFVTPSDSSTVTNTSSKQEVGLHPCRRRLCPPPRSLLSSSPTSCSADLLVGEGHRVSNLEEIVRVLKRMHSSLRLRREYWSSPPTSAELRLHHLILIHVNSYISLFDIEQSDDGRALAFSPLQQEGDDDDLDLEELYDALESKILPVSFANFLCDARKAACPRPEDDPLLRNTSTLKSMMEDNSRNGEKKEQLLHVLSDLEEIGRSRGYAPPLRGREIECYREIRNWALLSILFVYSSVALQSDALPPGDRFWCVPEEVHQFISHTPLHHFLSAGFEMIPFHRSFLDQCRRHISRILEKEEEEEAEEEGDDVVDADDHAEYNNDVDGDLVMEGGAAVDISNNTSAAAEAHQDNRGGGGTTPRMMSRVDCLCAIVSKFIRIGSLRCCPNPPTKEESRLYAQIAEHVHSSVFLFRCAADTQQTTTVTDSLKTIHAPDAWYYSNPDSDPSAARGNNKNMRGQYLREIVSYLEAMKSSCLGVIPTLEEMRYYMMLSRGLDHSFMSCSVFRDACVEGAGKMKQSSVEELRASLKAHLVSVCKSQMKFYEDAMKESASIIKLVQSAVMAGDDERDVEDYDIPTDEDVKKVKEFLGESRSERRLRQLNELIVILNELLFVNLSTSFILDAGREVAFARYRVGEDCCEIVARELLC